MLSLSLLLLMWRTNHRKAIAAALRKLLSLVCKCIIAIEDKNIKAHKGTDDRRHFSANHLVYRETAVRESLNNNVIFQTVTHLSMGLPAAERCRVRFGPTLFSRSACKSSRREQFHTCQQWRVVLRVGGGLMAISSFKVELPGEPAFPKPVITREL